MTDAKYHIPEVGALEGRVFRPSTPEELAEAVELAFDYRGDVTLQLASAEQITGDIFNCSVNDGTLAGTVSCFGRAEDSLC